MKYKGRYIKTVAPEDVGRGQIVDRTGRVWLTADLCGRFQPRDVGKQIWETSPGVLQIENEDQRKAREEELAACRAASIRKESDELAGHLQEAREYLNRAEEVLIGRDGHPFLIESGGWRFFIASELRRIQFTLAGLEDELELRKAHAG